MKQLRNTGFEHSRPKIFHLLYNYKVRNVISKLYCLGFIGLLMLTSCQTESVLPTAPVIQGITITPDVDLAIGDTLAAYCNVLISKGNSLTYSWWSEDGELVDTEGPWTKWVVNKEGLCVIEVTVEDNWHVMSASDTVWVEPNAAPQIIGLSMTPNDTIDVNDTLYISCARQSTPKVTRWRIPGGRQEAR